MNPVLAGRMAAYRRSFEKEQARTGGLPVQEVYGEVPQHLAYVLSDAKREVARTSRRAGKSTCNAGKLFRAVLEPPQAPGLYFAPTLKNARHILWPVLKRMNHQYNLGGVANESEAYMRFPDQPNEPRIYLFGGKDASEIDRARGHKAKRIIIDEAQAYRPDIFAQLVDDVCEPALIDYDGCLSVSGTPGAIKAGHFYDIDMGDAGRGYAHLHWTMLDNVHLAKLSGRPVADLLREVRERHGWTENHPTYVREYGGQWAEDPGALMLHYDRIRNGCEWQKEPVKGWTYVLGGDLGYEDSDALTVQGWAPNSRKVQKVAECVRAKQGITELGNATRALYDIWHPIAMPFDFGGLGKKIAIELQQRWSLPLEAAEKERKAEHIMLLDDAMLRGDYLAPPDSVLAQDCQIMQWDQEARAKGIWREDPAHHSDIMDADLYTFRKCWAYLERDAVVKPKVGTPEAFAAQERQMLQDRIEQMNRKREDPWYEQLAGDDE